MSNSCVSSPFRELPRELVSWHFALVQHSDSLDSWNYVFEGPRSAIPPPTTWMHNTLAEIYLQAKNILSKHYQESPSKLDIQIFIT